MRFWPFADLNARRRVRNLLAKTLEFTETDPAILACNVFSQHQGDSALLFPV
jgi:hypothetical protein